jgi:hypothetical protein
MPRPLRIFSAAICILLLISCATTDENRNPRTLSFLPSSEEPFRGRYLPAGPELISVSEYTCAAVPVLSSDSSGVEHYVIRIRLTGEDAVLFEEISREWAGRRVILKTGLRYIAAPIIRETIYRGDIFMVCETREERDRIMKRLGSE